MQKRVDEVMNFIYAELEKGTHPDDIMVWKLEGAIEWDQGLQSWKIDMSSVDLEEELGLQKDELVYLIHGRGDAEEHARVVGALGDGWYSLRFDVENRGSSSSSSEVSE